ncbi:crossover junction endodeoxyribonuclease RuvC [Candidatus Dojkabacteria bacterium]|nr:crossover junction endodeoxyribonuclease RuvC [Candidatus Dojkabacteria bacterium]
MRVLGIDPGTAITGWAILENDLGMKNNIKCIDYGVITTPAGLEMPLRLKDLYHELIEIIDKYKPESAAIEELFFFKNQKTVIKVGQARGVVIVALANAGLQIFDYTPLQVKQAVTGYGRAEKKQIQEMVRLITNLKEIPKPDDAADAIAVGICHLNSVR